MAATLHDILLTPDTQPAVIADCRSLIDQQVSEMSGVSGTAVKLAYKVVTSFAPGYYRDTLATLLPLLVDKLAPYWDDFNASGTSRFGDYLAKHGDEVTEAMLSVTDAMATASERPVIVKAYQNVRGNAAHHVRDALPQVGDLVQKYAA
jgi:hypothetical protein